jgi:hypothetical protein
MKSEKFEVKRVGDLKKVIDCIKNSGKNIIILSGTSVTLKRKGGWRVKYRKLKRARIPERHKIKKEEAMKWIEENLNVKVGKKEERTMI